MRLSINDVSTASTTSVVFIEHFVDHEDRANKAFAPNPIIFLPPPRLLPLGHIDE